MAQKNAPNPAREAWARHLRRADELSKKKQFEAAILELEQALRIDPKDMYARSFLERLRSQWSKKQEEAKAAIDAQEMSLEQRMEVIPKHLAVVDRLVAERNFKGALAEIAKVYKIDPTNYYAQAYSDRIDEMMREAEAKKSAPAEPPPPPPTTESDTGLLMFYRELLKEYWFDGKLTPEELAHLEGVRQNFGITSEQHDRLSQEVKFDAYVEAMRLAWIDGFLSETERRTLEFMRNKYAITPEENARAEAQVKMLRVERPAKDKIVIVDANKEESTAMAKGLKKHGYDIVLSAKPSDAFAMLQDMSPAALICETRFPEGEIDGFELYRRVRAYPPLIRIPVIFTVTITDKDLLYAAMRLGADAVLQKPVDPEFIVAMLQGRKTRNALAEG